MQVKGRVREGVGKGGRGVTSGGGKGCGGGGGEAWWMQPVCGQGGRRTLRALALAEPTTMCRASPWPADAWCRPADSAMSWRMALCRAVNEAGNDTCADRGRFM